MAVAGCLLVLSQVQVVFYFVIGNAISPQKPKKRSKHCWRPPHFIENDDGTIENMIQVDDSGWDQDKYLVGQHDEQQ